ncbi:MAG: hypothetical protein R6U65_11260 [Perlabentimonas sp.]
MINNLKSKLLSSPEWLIFIFVFFVFWLVNKSYTGPIIHDDEIGYLANAALISGHVIDGASKYHAGSSFFLAPLFVIFSDPSSIWQAIMAFNAFIWSVSFLLLACILKVLVPEYSKGQLFIALLISAAYPAWITMSGYAFATTAFVFVYLLSILTLLFWKPDKCWTIIPHCLAVGYLYWIHPIGLAVCVASFMVVGFVSIREKKYAAVPISIILLVVLIISYRYGIEKWLISLATPEGYNPISHYPGSERIIGSLFNYEIWLHFVSMSAGQISYLIVSSLGLIFFGFIASITKSYRLVQRHNKNNSTAINLTSQTSFAYLALSLLGVLAMGVLFFSVGGSNRIDHWIYGRYIEMVVLPLLAIGYLSTWHKKGLLTAVFFVFTTALILNYFVDITEINLIFNTVAFWPQYLFFENNYLYWMTAGSLLLFIVGLVKSQRNLSKIGNMLVIACLAMVFIASSVFHGFIHYNTVSVHGKPSALVEIIRKNYSPGTCVGLDPEGLDSMHDERIYKHPLHLFYLYDYAYRRMSPEEWLNYCEGPYFTYSLDDLYDLQGVTLIGKEMLSNIYLLVKDDGPAIALPEISISERDYYLANEWSVNYTINYEGNQLAELTGPAGFYEDESIYSLKEEGFVTSGPNIKLSTGEYNFVLRGEASIVDDSCVKIVPKRGEAEYAIFDIKDTSETGNAILASGKFLLEEPVYGLEVRVYSSSADIIRIDGYEIEYIQEVVE